MRAEPTPTPGILRQRVPNPPMCFVGREDETERVAHILEASSVAVVCGAGGMGKSALVRQVVRQWPGDAVQVRIRPEDDFALFAVELALASQVEESGSAERTTAGALSAMERDARLVVVEDLHYLPEAEAGRWLALLASYAHRSRWLLTSRVRPTLPDVQERVVQLGPLPPDAARALAQACRPDADEAVLARLVDGGAGSPLTIRQLAAESDGPGLGGAEARELAMLSVLREPIGAATRPGALDEIQLRGWLGPDLETRLHDAVRERVMAELSSEELQRARTDAVEALSRPDDARQALERLRLLLELGEFDAAASLLSERHGWIERGHGARLWSLLAQEEAPRLSTLRMEVARDIGTNTALNWLIHQPEPDVPRARVAWLEGLLASGRPRLALDAMQRGGAEHSPLLLGRALADAGHAAEALSHLRSIEPSDPIERVRHRLALAKAHYHAGDERDARRLLSDVRTELPRLPPRAAASLRVEAQTLLCWLGLAPSDDAAPRSAEGLVFHGLQLATAGRLERSSKLIARLLSTFDLPPGSGVLAGITSGVLGIARGQYRGLDGRARRAVHDAERLGNATLYHAAYLLERVANLGQAWESDELPWAPAIPPPTGAPARYLAMAQACHRARRGEPLDRIPQRRPSDGPLVASLSLLAEAHVRLLTGEPERACFLATQAANQADGDGLGLFVGEAVLTRVYAELALGRHVEVERGCHELAQVAERLGSARYRVLASLLRLAVPAVPDVATLLRIAGESNRSPTAARVANALLGAETQPDALDRLLVQSIPAGWTARIVPLETGRPAAWVLDALGRKAQTPRGTVDLSPLATRLLDGLFEHGGHATLPELARVGWGLDRFHPLRDSKRIHVAIRRLRQSLEDDASSPARLVTTPEGYGFGTPVGRWQTR